jgi:hypothetical protein
MYRSYSKILKCISLIISRGLERGLIEYYYTYVYSTVLLNTVFSQQV